MDTITTFPPSSHVYFRPTTVGQRRLLFSTVEETGNVSEASRRAHVSRGTYYYWRPRYESEGAAGLATERSRAPHRTQIPSVSADLRAEVLAYHQAHPTEGYRSIANGIGKAHQWKKMISHTKVQEIILADREAHAPPPAPAAPPVESFHLPTEAVHAPKPNQTINIDLCVVPLEHDGRPDMVSVSLSAAAAGVFPTENGRPATSAEWPGQTFENPALSYEEQMRDYAEKRRAKRLSKDQRKHQRRQKQAERAELNAQSDELRLQRRRQRARRRLEDADWKAKRQAHRDTERAWRERSGKERRAEHQAQQAQWPATKAERQAQVQQRQAEDTAWRQARQEVRNKLAQLAESAPLVTAWLAILVVVDNGTRRCLGLPLFTAGVHVTAEMVVAALRVLCPPELQFVISDNGAQFIAEAFARFAQEMAFVQVRIAPYRACTNGIAKRFVRTLKEWLETRSWNSPEELAALLVEFIEYYNDRPHQGAELDGLSPNEFARRLTDCSTC